MFPTLSWVFPTYFPNSTLLGPNFLTKLYLFSTINFLMYVPNFHMYVPNFLMYVPNFLMYVPKYIFIGPKLLTKLSCIFPTTHYLFPDLFNMFQIIFYVDPKWCLCSQLYFVSPCKNKQLFQNKHILKTVNSVLHHTRPGVFQLFRKISQEKREDGGGVRERGW